jgi:hypothetical protein
VTPHGINVTVIAINVTSHAINVTSPWLNVTEVLRAVRPMMTNTMRFKSQFPPQTAAERQRKCRAIKKGTWETIPATAIPLLPGAPREVNMNPNLLAAAKAALALPGPQTTAIEKASPAAETLALPDAVDVSCGETIRLRLPAGVAARLKSLLNRHHAGKTLTAAERAEAEGLLDIAEYFAVQRMRKRLAA